MEKNWVHSPNNSWVQEVKVRTNHPAEAGPTERFRVGRRHPELRPDRSPRPAALGRPGSLRLWRQDPHAALQASDTGHDPHTGEHSSKRQEQLYLRLQVSLDVNLDLSPSVLAGTRRAPR